MMFRVVCRAYQRKISFLVFLPGRQMNRGITLSISRKCVLDTQDMKQGKRTVCGEKSNTNQTTFHAI